MQHPPDQVRISYVFVIVVILSPVYPERYAEETT